MDKSKTTIAFVIYSLENGGRERRLVQLLKGLTHSERYDIHLIMAFDKIVYDDVYALDIHMHNFGEAISFGERYKTINKLMANIKPDIVHSWLDNSIDIILVALKLKYGYKYIAGFVADGIKSSYFSKISFIHTIAFAAADAIVSNSQAGLVAKRAPLRKSKVIFNGFNFNRLTPDLDKTQKRAQLNIQTKYAVCMIARFSPEKDYPLFMNIAEIAHATNQDITFLAVGEGEKLSNCKQHAKDKKITNLLFTGQRSDVEEIIQACDVSMLFCLTALHAEGVSNSIMESMAAGVPVIATNSGGTPEIIKDGENGFMVEDGDAERAYRLLVELLTDTAKRQQMGHAAFKTIKERFSIENMLSEYEALYENLENR